MNIGIILTAGSSKRMNGTDKINAIVNGKPLWKYSYEVFQKNRNIQKVYLVIKKKFRTTEKIETIPGGKTRFESAKKAFFEITKKENLKDEDIVIFHNAANPILTSQELDLVIDKAKKHGACIAGQIATDTIKIINGDKIEKTLERKKILLAQTPQAFQVRILKKAYTANASSPANPANKKTPTDEASLIEQFGIKPHWIAASEQNRKITTREDLKYFRLLMEGGLTGIGTDSHWFDKNGTLILAGIKIKEFPKLKANSDGDIGIHALGAAISQTLGQGSLGTFADEMNKKGITRSTQFLKPLLAELKKRNLNINHIGLHFECLIPRIDPLVPKIKKSLCRIFKIQSEQIGITATSGEKMTPWGKGKGVHCIALVNLVTAKNIKNFTKIILQL